MDSVLLMHNNERDNDLNIIMAIIAYIKKKYHVVDEIVDFTEKINKNKSVEIFFKKYTKFLPLIREMALYKKYYHLRQNCLLEHHWLSCSVALPAHLITEKTIETVGNFGIVGGTALTVKGIGMSATGVGAIVGIPEILGGTTCVVSGQYLVMNASGISNDVGSMMTNFIDNLVLPNNQKIDMNRDIKIISENVLPYGILPYHEINNEMVRIYQNAIHVRRYIENDETMESINNVKNVINMLGPYQEEFDIKIKGITEIPDDNTDLDELFNKYHPEYFNAQSSKNNYSSDMKVTYMNGVTVSGGGGIGNSLFLILIPIITIPLTGGCLIV